MLSIFFIGLALSMDAFSIALSIGTTSISKFKKYLIPIIVGIMHFIMPLLGHLLGNQLFNIININSKLFVSLIFLYLAIIMFLDRNKKTSSKISSILSIFLFAFSVSIDSFSVGLGITGITNHIILSFIIFSICSGTITAIGLIIGKYSIKYLKEKSVYLGIFILLILAIVNICQFFTY